MAKVPEPITGATIEIYRAEDYGVTGPIDTADPKAEDPGYYKAEELDEGDYTYKVSAPDKGTVVGDFTLPDPSDKEAIQKNIPPITLVSGALASITLYDKDGKTITKDGATGPTGPTGVTGITGDVDIEVARLFSEGGGEGVYTVDDVPIGERLIEIKPSDPTVYQNLKLLRNISKPTTDIDITLYPPVTLYVTVYKNDITTKPPQQVIDTNCRLFEVTETGNKIREITTKTSSDFKIGMLANGVIHLLVTKLDGITKLGDIATFTIDYAQTTEGIMSRGIIYTGSHSEHTIVY